LTVSDVRAVGGVEEDDAGRSSGEEEDDVRSRWRRRCRGRKEKLTEEDDAGSHVRGSKKTVKTV
jgi:hypothetical protein